VFDQFHPRVNRPRIGVMNGTGLCAIYRTISQFRENSRLVTWLGATTKLKIGATESSRLLAPSELIESSPP
jgi:hypothetical protein